LFPEEIQTSLLGSPVKVTGSFHIRKEAGNPDCIPQEITLEIIGVLVTVKRCYESF